MLLISLCLSKVLLIPFSIYAFWQNWHLQACFLLVIENVCKNIRLVSCAVWRLLWIFPNISACSVLSLYSSILRNIIECDLWNCAVLWKCSQTEKPNCRLDISWPSSKYCTWHPVFLTSVSTCRIALSN